MDEVEFPKAVGTTGEVYQGTVAGALDPDGNVQPLQVDADGALLTSGGGDGGPIEVNQGAAGGTPWPVSLSDYASQTTLAAILAKLTSDPATQTTLAQILAKLSSDPATQTTLAAVLAKLSSDPATQTTLAAVLTALQGTLTTNQASRVASTSDVNAPASNTAAVITYAAAGAGVSHAIGGVAWSYSSDPTAGNLKIEDGSGNVVFQVDITSKGPGFFTFPRPKKGSANTALIITLAAGGSGVTGKVNATSHWTE